MGPNLVEFYLCAILFGRGEFRVSLGALWRAFLEYGVSFVGRIVSCVSEEVGAW